MDITEILGSLSNEDMAKLQSAAAGLLKNMNSSSGQSVNELPADEKPPAAASAENTAPALPGVNLPALSALGKLMNSDDDRIRLIEALKPLLSEGRQKKADEAEKMLRLMSALPALKDSGLLNGLI